MFKSAWGLKKGSSSTLNHAISCSFFFFFAGAGGGVLKDTKRKVFMEIASFNNYTAAAFINEERTFKATLFLLKA